MSLRLEKPEQNRSDLHLIVFIVVFQLDFIKLLNIALEVDQISGWYLGFTDISISAKTANIIGLSRCWQNAVIFLTHADNLRNKAQRTKSRQLSCSNASTCVFI